MIFLFLRIWSSFVFGFHWTIWRMLRKPMLSDN